MRILELFSGTGIFSQVARERGHTTFTLDYSEDMVADLHMDIMEFAPERHLPLALDWGVDVVWASPPCTVFSVAAIGKNWLLEDGRYIPRRKEADEGVAIAKKTLEIIERIHPKRFFIENPRGILRKMPWMPKQRKTVTYCQYGEKRMKPTDIWTDSSWVWKARPACANGSPCHVSAPRGSKTPGSTQGINGAKDRGALPRQLCEEIIEHLEKELV